MPRGKRRDELQSEINRPLVRRATRGPSVSGITVDSLLGHRLSQREVVIGGWIEIPEIKDEGGRLRHVRGVTESPGLYMLGTTWQHTRTSALLGWVGNDSAYLADRIEAAQQAPAAAAQLAQATS